MRSSTKTNRSEKRQITRDRAKKKSTHNRNKKRDKANCNCNYVEHVSTKTEDGKGCVSRMNGKPQASRMQKQEEKQI